MIRRKDRKRKGSSKLELIGPALIPAVALTAVPSSPAPQCLPGNPLGLASVIFGDSFLHLHDQNSGVPSHAGIIGGAADLDGSAGDEFDDDDEAGYTSVTTFRNDPKQSRMSYSDRDRVPTPTLVRSAPSADVLVSQSGEVYHILEPDATAPDSQEDIYSLPMKKKGAGGKKGDGEGTSMDRTRRDVHLAMQAVHDMPVEETMMRLSASRQAPSSGRGTMRDFEDDEESETPPPLPPPLTADNIEEESETPLSPPPPPLTFSNNDERSQTLPPPPPHPLTANNNASDVQPLSHLQTETSVSLQPGKSSLSHTAVSLHPSEASPRSHTQSSSSQPETQTLVHDPIEASLSRHHQTEATPYGQKEKSSHPRSKTSPQNSTKSSASRRKKKSKHTGSEKGHPQTSPEPRVKAIDCLRQEMETPLSPGSGESNTPQDAASLSMQMEAERIKEENHRLFEEIVGLKKVAAAVKKEDDKEVAESQNQMRQVQSMKEENEMLKKTVGRLNQELSRYQAKFRPLSADDQSKLEGLKIGGAVPSWLVNKRYLAPLFMSYDDLIQEKQEGIHQCQEELEILKEQIEKVVRENQRYQLQGGNYGAGYRDTISASNWQQLQEQARLVLEENQILTEQLDIQQTKVKDHYSSHLLQVSQLTKRITACETEKGMMENAIEEMRHKFQDVRIKYDKALLESGTHMTMQDHVNNVADLKRSVTEEKEQFEEDMEQMEVKLKASDEERKRQALVAIELQTENKQLKAEIAAIHKSVRRSQSKILLLKQAIQQCESKELLTQSELANCIKIVEKTTLERDTALKVAKEQQRDAKETMSHMMGNSMVMGKMEEKLKEYKLKASARLQTIAEKLKDQDDLFNRQRQEYEREICYLRTLLKEKEQCLGEMQGEKKTMEEDLEVMWQAANSENQHLKDTLISSVNKLRQHSSLKSALEEEDDLEKLLHFSAR